MKPRAWLCLLLLAAGCATHPPLTTPPRIPAAQLFPADALVTQRGILTVRGRQFTLNGYVAKSAAHGLRLVMTEGFGGTLADVLIKPDGGVFVMQAKPPFRPAWVKNYIAEDVRGIFADGTNCPLQVLSPAHFVIQRRWYKLDLQTVSVKPGAQPAAMFDETTGARP